MSKLRLKDDMWPAQGWVGTQLWSWEFSFDLCGLKPFITLSWSLQILRGLKASVVWGKFAVSLMEIKCFTNMRHCRTNYVGKVMFQPPQKPALYGAHLVLSPQSLENNSPIIKSALVVPLAQSILRAFLGSLSFILQSFNLSVSPLNCEQGPSPGQHWVTGM